MSYSAAFAPAFDATSEVIVTGGIVLGPHRITVVRPGSKASDYGSGTVPDWDAATRTSYTGCSVQPVVGDEYTVDRDNTTSRWQAWAPGACDVTGGDRVEFDGDTYEVDGHPQRWGFPPLDHVVIPLSWSADA